MTDTRCANSIYGLEVDEMVLEYMLYNTIKAHLDEAKTRGIRESFRPETPQRHLRMFDSFMSVFKINHKGHEFSANTDFNLRLLQFLLLFVYQQYPAYIPSETKRTIMELRQRNVIARQAWLAVHRNWISAPEDRVSSSWEDHNDFEELDNQPGTVSRDTIEARIWLKDLLPLFMSLSAVMARKLGQSVNELWMMLAADFMLQSVLEQYRNMYPHLNCLRSAFAWGWQPEDLRKEILTSKHKRKELHLDEVDSEVWDEEKRILHMFASKNAEEESAEDEGGVNDEILHWNAIKRQYLDYFGEYPDPDSDIGIGSGLSPEDERHNQQARREWLSTRTTEMLEEFGIEEFEQKIIAYLERLGDLCTKPLLVQIEEGEIEGLTKAQFAEFRKSCFLDACGSFRGERG